jgi:hypothetical protein
MNAKELFQSDLKKIKVMLDKEQANSDGWWKIKELRGQCQISWGQAANLAMDDEGAGLFKDKHAEYYSYLTSPYREWIDRDPHLVNIDDEIEENLIK